MRAYIHTCIYVSFRLRPVSRPSFFYEREVDQRRARQRAARSTCCTCYLPRQVQSYVLWFFFFVVYHTRYRGFYFVFRVVPALRERWLHGCALILSPFFLLFFPFFFSLTILYFNTVDSTRRDGTNHITRFVFYDFRGRLFCYIVTSKRILSYSACAHTQLLFSRSLLHTRYSIRSSSLSLSLTRAILVLSHSALTNSFFCHFSLSLSVTRVITFIRRASRPRTIDFFFLPTPLTRNFRLIEKKNEEKT